MGLAPGQSDDIINIERTEIKSVSAKFDSRAEQHAERLMHALLDHATFGGMSITCSDNFRVVTYVNLYSSDGEVD